MAPTACRGAAQAAASSGGEHVSGFEIVSRHEAEDAARDAAGLLVGRGIGATVAEHEPPEGEADAGRWCVEVLPEDHGRACEVLGLEVPEPEEPEKPPMAPWKIMALVWLAAMIILPVLAFWLTVNLAD